MNPLVCKIARAVRAANPSFDAIEEFDAIAELDRLAGEMSKRPDSLKFNALPSPVAVGNVSLYPLTLGAELWVEQFCGWFPDKEGAHDVATLFAMAHGWRPAKAKTGFLKSSLLFLHELDRPDLAWKTVYAWAERCTESADAMIEAAKNIRGASRRGITGRFKLDCVRAMLATGSPDGAATLLKSLDEKQPDSKDDHDGIGEVLSFLMDTYGQTPEYWLWEQPEANVIALLNAKVNREARSAATDEKQVKAREAWEDEAHVRFFAAARAFGRKYGIADVTAPATPPQTAQTPEISPSKPEAVVAPPPTAQTPGSGVPPPAIGQPITADTLPWSGNPNPQAGME